MPSGGDHQLGELDGANRRRAHLVDGVGGNLLRDPGRDRRLTGRSLTDPGLEHLTHDDVADVLGCNAGAVEAGPNRDRAQLDRGAVGEPSAEPTEGSPDGRDDDCG